MIFACIDKNNNVFNIIIADSLQIAESVTNSVCVELTNKQIEYVAINECDYINGVFIPKNSPYSSWTWNQQEELWVPPIPKPDSFNRYIWNEELLSWQLDTNDSEYS